MIKSWKVRLIFFLAIDLFFTVKFFSEKAALALPFIITPFVFVLFLAFFQDPKSFMRQWNGWLIWILKLSFLAVGLLIYIKTSYFPSLNDFLSSPIFSTTAYIGRTESILFVLLATMAQIGFMIGIIFNVLNLLFPSKLGPNAPEIEMSFFRALPLSILFTGLFTIGLLYLGIFLK